MAHTKVNEKHFEGTRMLMKIHSDIDIIGGALSFEAFMRKRLKFGATRITDTVSSCKRVAGIHPTRAVCAIM